MAGKYKLGTVRIFLVSRIKAGYVPEQVGMQQGIQVIRHNQMPLLQADEYVRQDGQKLSGSP